MRLATTSTYVKQRNYGIYAQIITITTVKYSTKAFSLFVASVSKYIFYYQTSCHFRFKGFFKIQIVLFKHFSEQVSFNTDTQSIHQLSSFQTFEFTGHTPKKKLTIIHQRKKTEKEHQLTVKMF